MRLDLHPSHYSLSRRLTLYTATGVFTCILGLVGICWHFSPPQPRIQGSSLDVAQEIIETELPRKTSRAAVKWWMFRHGLRTACEVCSSGTDTLYVRLPAEHASLIEFYFDNQNRLYSGWVREYDDPACPPVVPAAVP